MRGRQLWGPSWAWAATDGRHKMPQRRFPPPWSVEEQDACFVVRDHAGQALAFTLPVVVEQQVNVESK